MSEDYRKYLDPAVLEKVAGLEVKARLVVEGFMAGRHESPYKGSSVEFAEHREYAPGDDLRRIDWKVYGKSDRFYLKEFEEETNLKAYIAVDASASMGYAGAGRVSKLEYSKYAAAAILHLVHQQRDSGALVAFGSGISTFVPPGSSSAHHRNLIENLSGLKAEGPSGIGPVFDEIASRLRQRSLVAVFSDLLDDEASVLRGLQHMAHRGHDVILFHVMDSDELNFPFERMSRFEGLEDMERLLLDPKAVREAYLAEVNSFRARLTATCLAGRMDFVALDTSAPLDKALGTWLARRSGTR
ncbi:MAG: DUF58 domain-containing protein [Planctomycetes bacterium]|nr:DUF58 domain-containing protein [Planctomycetota bacterium]